MKMFDVDVFQEGYTTSRLTARNIKKRLIGLIGSQTYFSAHFFEHKVYSFIYWNKEILYINNSSNFKRIILCYVPWPLSISPFPTHNISTLTLT